MLEYSTISQEDTDRATERQALALKLKALGDRTRLAILDMLMDGMHCNCEIAAHLGISLSLVSHHVQILRQAGLVQGERDPEDARWIYYAVDPEAVRALQRTLDGLLDLSRLHSRVAQRCCRPLCDSEKLQDE